MNFLQKTINYLFGLLVFITPLVFYHKTSELFEFNKMVMVYIFIVLICGLWLARMIMERKTIFRRTILDIPIIIFLTSQLLSTLTSIDVRTSVYGYYSRFHGGLLSYFSYSLLYWAFVSNVSGEFIKKIIYASLASGVLVSLWAIFEHFGYSFSCFLFTSGETSDVSCWVQDVKNRVFATFGQPNWLAAYLVTVIPITWAFALNSKLKTQNSKLQFKIQNYWLWSGLSALFFVTLLYTKSRSGIAGFVVADLIFWGGLILVKKFVLKQFFILQFVFLILASAFGTPWTPSVFAIFGTKEVAENEITTTGPALETGGTESGKIRSIVWKGAIDLWKRYPILGTGVETFAFAYYEARPPEHNFVSEWDFLYNKAHNEYLNFAATTGTLGIASYLVLIGAILYQFKIQNSKFKITVQNLKISENNFELCTLNFALMSGFAGILITNFFGFSVVLVGLYFFLLPALSTASENAKVLPVNIKFKKLDFFQKIFLFLVLLLSSYLLISVGRYWYGDYLYAYGKQLADSGEPLYARDYIGRAVKISGKESIYWDELSQASVDLALLYSEKAEQKNTMDLANSAITESRQAVSLSPRNVNIRRNQASIFVKLSILDQIYLVEAKSSLQEAIKLAPTDAKLYYNLALTEARLGNIDESIKILESTIRIKSNYRDARLALALFLIEKGEISRAKEELMYILESIDPNDTISKEQLETLN